MGGGGATMPPLNKPLQAPPQSARNKNVRSQSCHVLGSVALINESFSFFRVSFPLRVCVSVSHGGIKNTRSGCFIIFPEFFSFVEDNIRLFFFVFFFLLLTQGIELSIDPRS